MTQNVHEIDYELIGEEMQFVKIELDPEESVIAEAGALMYMEDGISMETVFGEDSKSERGLLGKFLGAGKRVLTGESLFMTVFTNIGQGKKHVSFASPYPGKIISMDLSELNGRIVCQRDAFLCAAKGVSIGIDFQKKNRSRVLRREGFIMQKIEGDGFTFVHAGGTIEEKELEEGEKLRVDTGCLVAITGNIDYDVQFVSGVKTALFGREGLFMATLQGPGKFGCNLYLSAG